MVTTRRQSGRHQIVGGTAQDNQAPSGTKRHLEVASVPSPEKRRKTEATRETQEDPSTEGQTPTVSASQEQALSVQSYATGDYKDPVDIVSFLSSLDPDVEDSDEEDQLPPFGLDIEGLDNGVSAQTAILGTENNAEPSNDLPTPRAPEQKVSFREREVDSPENAIMKEPAETTTPLPALGNDMSLSQDTAKHNAVMGGPTDRRSVDGISMREPAESGVSVLKPSTHVRFGSEDIPIPMQSLSSATTPETKELALDGAQDGVASRDSDDEAPEAVTQSSAIEQSRTAEVETERVLKQQRQQERKKRQEQALRLQQQAAAAASTRSREKRKATARASAGQEHRGQAAIDAIDQALADGAERKTVRKRPFNLPPFLSEEILNAEPVVRPPTPPTSHEGEQRQSSKRHKRFDDVDEKPVKDVKKGPLNVRVLEKSNTLLPPKASKSSKGIKEGWLQGRKGKGGKMNAERKKIGSGFLRKA